MKLMGFFNLSIFFFTIIFTETKCHHIFQFIFSKNFTEKYGEDGYYKFHQYANDWHVERIIPFITKKSKKLYINNNLDLIKIEIFSQCLKNEKQDLYNPKPVLEAIFHPKENFHYIYYVHEAGIVEANSFEINDKLTYEILLHEKFKKEN